jgi:PII-like signaling protein
VQAREAGLAGATVFRGIGGFGARSRIHTAKILRLSEDLPVLVEIVDTEEKIRAFIPVVDGLFRSSRCGGMMSIEKVEVIRYTPGEGGAAERREKKVRKKYEGSRRGALSSGTVLSGGTDAGVTLSG